MIQTYTEPITPRVDQDTPAKTRDWSLWVKIPKKRTVIELNPPKGGVVLLDKPLHSKTSRCFVDEASRGSPGQTEYLMCLIGYSRCFRRRISAAWSISCRKSQAHTSLYSMSKLNFSQIHWSLQRTQAR